MEVLYPDNGTVTENGYLKVRESISCEYNDQDEHSVFFFFLLNNLVPLHLEFLKVSLQ